MKTAKIPFMSVKEIKKKFAVSKKQAVKIKNIYKTNPDNDTRYGNRSLKNSYSNVYSSPNRQDAYDVGIILPLNEQYIKNKIEVEDEENNPEFE